MCIRDRWSASYDGHAASGFLNVDWQTIYRGGGFIGGFDTAYLPLTTVPYSLSNRALAQEDVDHVSMFMSSNSEEGSLQNSTGRLQVYATNVLMDPGFGYVGWVFSTFSRSPLEYSASFGEATIRGKFYVKFYSPSGPYMGSCYAKMHRAQALGSRTPNPQ
eukprot:TRINITY_DN38657_c0_g1_i1.p1 TRINITY_DN38657_c0_g1~~TRINITY_DN38657_c0_g1_i1.p1  ORF type:complete len:161 (+),score=20.63 TRINITY_DN38657_c0_g1_i1:152-634(+)